MATLICYGEMKVEVLDWSTCHFTWCAGGIVFIRCIRETHFSVVLRFSFIQSTSMSSSVHQPLTLPLPIPHHSEKHLSAVYPPHIRPLSLLVLAPAAG
jgi:hypothetical protein